MNPLRNMDLYKGVILASLLLLPVTGWWINGTMETIEATRRAISAATRTDGYLMEIGKLQKQIETVEANRVSNTGLGEVKVYFQNQLHLADPVNLKDDDFTVLPVQQEHTRIGQQQEVTDHVVGIRFERRGGKDFVMSREFLFAMLFNCESGAQGHGQTSAVPSIWKLRKLHVKNDSVPDNKGAPPQPLEDRWVVRSLEFARREPRKN